ncbi:MAG: tryptophan synthase subunit alpha [Verrucomicrobiota bacterium]
MDRIASTFARCKAEGRPAFVSYVCAGDPDLETSKAVLLSLARNGADVLEVGVPFSDPLADGLTNQLASQRALEGGMDGARLLELLRALRAGTELPIVLYCYYNLLFSAGVENYCRKVREAGADGLLVLDCPPEEAGELIAASKKHGLSNIFIVAPTTPPARVALIAKHASGFIYYVSREGVTGERSELAVNLGAAVSEIRKHTALPVCVGFGVSTAAHVRAIAKVADGVVVGSALVNVIAAHRDRRAEAAEAVGAKVRELLAK